MVAFLSGAVLTAANLNSAFNALTFRAVTGVSDTLVLADNGGAVSYSNASAITATVPPFSSVAYANGTVIQLLNLGAGVVTITAGVGVTLNGSVVTLAQNAGGTLIKTATNTWYFLPSASAGAGMDLMTPSGVVNGTLSGGEVSFSAAATLSVNGCFTSTYDAYMIWAVFSASVDAAIPLRLRSAGTDASAANYDFQELVVSNATTTQGRATSQTSGRFAYTSTDTFVTINIQNPALAAITYYFTNVVYGPGITLVSVAGRHTPATAYDGFSIIPSSGNITGKLRVYGLKKS
jgi:hypothetical protein